MSVICMKLPCGDFLGFKFHLNFSLRHEYFIKLQKKSVSVHYVLGDNVSSSKFRNLYGIK